VMVLNDMDYQRNDCGGNESKRVTYERREESRKFNARCSHLYTGPEGSHLTFFPSFDDPVIKFLPALISCSIGSAGQLRIASLKMDPTNWALSFAS
jgi:hypothetical protein